MANPKILITSGARLIGSQTAVHQTNAGHHVVIIDNLCNSSSKLIDRIKNLASKNISFVELKVRNSSGLHRIFKKHTIDGVIHFAGFKAVGESVVQHLTYFYNNVGSTLFHWQAMGRVGVRRIVFSSSATVYRNPKQVPISENSQLHVTNPYGRTKLIYEGIGRGLQAPQNSNLRNIATLRYFNPIGAHISGTIGEHPKAITNNIIPFIIQVALGKHEILNTFGNYYSTNDGTGVRDSIHVVDLAQGHLAAFDFRKKKIKHNGQLRHWSWS